LRRFTL
jgi:hypothetical protein